MNRFIGRKDELEALNSRISKKSASFVAIRGRRRIGKSRLIEEFSKKFSKKYLFTGLPPTVKVTKKEQRLEFIRQMKAQGLPEVSGDDWGDIFWVIGKACERDSVIISFDEIAWMGSKDPLFLGKLKIAWDQYFEKNSKLVLIVASSISSWIDKNILKSTGFFGRVDLILTLKELPIQDCLQFWEKRNNTISTYEKLKLLGITGGVPKYLSEINPKQSAESNIQKLCFSEYGLLYNEFDRIFHDLFSRRSEIYKKIVEQLATVHSLTQQEICDGINRPRGRVISGYLNDLETAGFLSSDHTWNLKSKSVSKLRKYRLSDNYLRFYLKYIAPNKMQISKGIFQNNFLSQSMNWDSIMGLQFENLVILNQNVLRNMLRIAAEDCINQGPYFQTATKRRKGCQIDFLIQTKNTLYPCEIKFSRKPVSSLVIEEMEKKIRALDIPKHVSYRPVLIHVNGVSDEVKDLDYFDQIIDWSTLLQD